MTLKPSTAPLLLSSTLKCRWWKPSASTLLKAAVNACARYWYCWEGDKHITLATLIEFMHTSTLLHDDVVDESHMRRGKKTANE